MVSVCSLVHFWSIIIKVAGNQGRHKSWASSIYGRVRPLILELRKFHTFELEYLWSQLANLDQILCVVSLGWGKGCIRFWGRLDQNSGFHGNRKPPPTYNEDMHNRPTMGKWCLYATAFIFDWIIIKVAGNQDRHKSLDKFDFGPLVSMAHSCVFLKWDLTLAHWTQVSDRCPLGYLFFFATVDENILQYKSEFFNKINSDFLLYFPHASDRGQFSSWCRSCPIDKHYTIYSDVNVLSNKNLFLGGKKSWCLII